MPASGFANESLNNATTGTAPGIGIKADLTEKEEPNYGPLAGSAALVPGIIFHGSGHFVAGDRANAGRLLLLEGISLVTFFAGAVPLGYSGASDKLIATLVPVIAAGFGGFFISFFSDIYGTITGGRVLPAKLPPGNMTLWSEYRFVENSLFQVNHVVVAGFSYTWQSLTLAPQLMQAVDDENFRFELKSSYRFFEKEQLNYLDAAANLFYHQYGSENFNLSGAELFASAGYDLARFLSTLRGSYLKLQLGFGLENYAIDFIDESDFNESLIMQIGYGMLLPNPLFITNVLLYYDHRRNGFEGGLPGGFIGHFGLKLTLHFPKIDLQTSFIAGSSLISSLQLLYRF